MNARDEIMYLSIAGCTIQVIFHATDWIYAKKTIKEDIRETLEGFLVPKAETIHYTIEFVYRSKLDTLCDVSDEGNYVLCYHRKKKKNTFTTYYFINIIQFQFIILKDILDEYLSLNEGFILHASASNIDGKAHVFVGPPGSGKTTTVKLLWKKYPPLADDSVIIKREANAYCLYQTPFTEKEHTVKKSKQKYELDKIYFLKKNTDSKITLIKEKSRIVKEICSHFWNNKASDKQRKQAKKFAHSFNSFFTLSLGGDTRLIREIKK